MADISKITLPSGDTYNLKDGSAVHTSGNESISGDKTFSGTVSANTLIAPAATSSAAGLMSASDKEKLDMMTPLRIYNSTLQCYIDGQWVNIPIDNQPMYTGAGQSLPRAEGVNF